MYVPATCLTPGNAEFLVRQKQAAEAGSPPPDFPGAGGPGESGFKDAIQWDTVSKDGHMAMGMGSKGWNISENMSEGERAVIQKANRLVFDA